MPAYQQISAVLWGLGVGAATILAIYFTVRGGWFRKPLVGDPRQDAEMPEPVQPVHEYAEGIAEGHGPVPIIVSLVIIGFTIWAIGYVVVFVQRGYTFS
jgi:uncharacterized membrane protein